MNPACITPAVQNTDLATLDQQALELTCGIDVVTVEAYKHAPAMDNKVAASSV